MKKDIKLGDAIANITKFLGIPHCEKCEKRRQILNRAGELSLRELKKQLDNCCESRTK